MCSGPSSRSATGHESRSMSHTCARLAAVAAISCSRSVARIIACPKTKDPWSETVADAYSKRPRTEAGSSGPRVSDFESSDPFAVIAAGDYPNRGEQRSRGAVTKTPVVFA